MPTGRPPLSDEVLLHRVSVYEACDENQTKAAQALGITRSALEETLKAASVRGLNGFDPLLPEFNIASINTIYDKDGAVVRQSVRQVPAPGPKLEVLDGFDIALRSTLFGWRPEHQAAVAHRAAGSPRPARGDTCCCRGVHAQKPDAGYGERFVAWSSNA